MPAMNLSVESTRFTDTEAGELEKYRPVNPWAIASIALGLLSSASLLHLLLLIISVLGIVSGFFALRRIAARESMQSGRAAAMCGIFLSVMFGSWAIAGTMYRQHLITKQARACAERWLEMVRRGELHAAHQLVLEEAKRVAAGASLEKHYQYRERKLPTRRPDTAGFNGTDVDEMMAAMEPTPYEQFNQWSQTALMKRMQELGTRAKFQYLGTSQQTPVGLTDLTLHQQFGVSDEQDPSKRFVVDIEMERTVEDGVASWRILEMKDLSSR